MTCNRDATAAVFKEGALRAGRIAKRYRVEIAEGAVEDIVLIQEQREGCKIKEF